MDRSYVLFAQVRTGFFDAYCTYVCVYDMNVACHSCLMYMYADWNTYSDEDAVPQLKQVSGAALACCLKHTGLLNYAIFNK